MVVKDRNGRLQSRQRFLIQLGSTPVTFASAAPRRAVTQDTATVVLSVSGESASPALWKAALQNPKSTAKEWLRLRAKVEAVDTRPPTRDESGRLQVIATIPKGGRRQALAAAGIDGVWVRPFYVDGESRNEHRVIPLPEESSLASARRQAEWLGERSRGLVPTRRGYAIRVDAPDYDDALRAVRPTDFAQFTGKKWEVSGLPLSMGRDSVVEFLEGWEVTPVYTYFWRFRRTWVVRAEDPPPYTVLQHDYGIAVIKEEMPRQPRASGNAPPHETWRPSRGTPRTEPLVKSWVEAVQGPARPAARPTRAPQAATDAERRPKRPAPEAVDGDGDRAMPDAAAGGAAAAAAIAAAGGNEDAAFHTSAAVQSMRAGPPPDLTALISAAVAAAMAPLTTQVSKLQVEFTAIRNAAVEEEEEEVESEGGEGAEVAAADAAVPPRRSLRVKGANGRGSAGAARAAPY